MRRFQRLTRSPISLFKNTMDTPQREICGSIAQTNTQILKRRIFGHHIETTGVGYSTCVAVDPDILPNIQSAREEIYKRGRDTLDAMDEGDEIYLHIHHTNIATAARNFHDPDVPDQAQRFLVAQLTAIAAVEHCETVESAAIKLLREKLPIPKDITDKEVKTKYQDILHEIETAIIHELVKLEVGSPQIPLSNQTIPILVEEQAIKVWGYNVSFAENQKIASIAINQAEEHIKLVQIHQGSIVGWRVQDRIKAAQGKFGIHKAIIPELVIPADCQEINLRDLLQYIESHHEARSLSKTLRKLSACCSILMAERPNKDLSNVPMGEYNAAYVRVLNPATNTDTLYYININPHAPGVPTPVIEEIPGFNRMYDQSKFAAKSVDDRIFIEENELAMINQWTSHTHYRIDFNNATQEELNEILRENILAKVTLTKGDSFLCSRGLGRFGAKTPCELVSEIYPVNRWNIQALDESFMCIDARTQEMKVLQISTAAPRFHLHSPCIRTEQRERHDDMFPDGFNYCVFNPHDTLSNIAQGYRQPPSTEDPIAKEKERQEKSPPRFTYPTLD